MTPAQQRSLLSAIAEEFRDVLGPGSWIPDLVGTPEAACSAEHGDCGVAAPSPHAISAAEAALHAGNGAEDLHADHGVPADGARAEHDVHPRPLSPQLARIRELLSAWEPRS